MAKQHGKHPDTALAQNRKARHDYAVEETYEAGIALTGTEIKSVRDRRVNLKDGFVQVRNGEAWMQNVHISPFKEGTVITLTRCGPGNFCCTRKKSVS